MGWIELALAMALFMVSHRLPLAFGLKARIIATFGTAGYLAAFSLLSLLLLWWVLSAAGRAPFVPLWDQAGWHRLVVNVAMPLACALAAFGIAAPNPFAFEGRAQGFDPARPGIAGLTRQPLLWALALWAGAHLLANGDLAHVMVFAPFLALALIGIPAFERRRKAAIGKADWQRLSARTSVLPGHALILGRWRPQSGPDLPRLALACAAWAALWTLHPIAIGVWPGP